MSTFPPQTPGEPVSVIPKDIELCRFIENGRFLRTFQDVHLIGKGGFGTVFAATHRLEPTRTMYALKVVELELLDNQNLGTRRYFREVSTNQDLLSKHVVRYFTWWCEEPQFLPAPSEVPRHAHAANLAMQKQRSLTRRAPAGSNRRPPLPSPSPISTSSHTGAEGSPAPDADFQSPRPLPEPPSVIECLAPAVAPVAAPRRQKRDGAFGPPEIPMDSSSTEKQWQPFTSSDDSEFSDAPPACVALRRPIHRHRTRDLQMSLEEPEDLDIEEEGDGAGEDMVIFAAEPSTPVDGGSANSERPPGSLSASSPLTRTVAAQDPAEASRLLNGFKCIKSSPDFAAAFGRPDADIWPDPEPSRKARARKFKRLSEAPVVEKKPYRVALIIQMEYCRGLTLRQWLDRPERSTEPMQFIMAANGRPMELDFFRQLAKGLRDIHAKGVVHRDIKPENIFVDPESGSLKIGDFGLARFIEAQHTTIPSSQDGSSQGQNGTAERGMFHVDSLASVRGRLIGTPGYAAPEGGAFCTGKADVFSAALILLELLCPRFNTAMERLKTLEKFRITGECPAFLDGALPEWCGLLHAMGQHDPPRRPAAAVVYSRVKQNLRDLCTNS
eukprot:Polyplicarium_translucidae@DN2806_c0_g1_i1.p1